MSNFRNYGTHRGGSNGFHYNHRERGGRRWFPYRGRGRDWNSFRGNGGRNEGNFARYRRDPNEEIVQLRRDPGIPASNVNNGQQNGRANDNGPTWNRDSRSRSIATGTGQQVNVQNTHGFNNCYPYDPVAYRAAAAYAGPPVQYGGHNQDNSEQRQQVPVSMGVDNAARIMADPRFREQVEQFFANYKISGDFDKIRRACLIDMDTKPAFRNAVDKVQDISKRFLDSARFHPRMDKGRNRASLKKSFEMSQSYQNSLDSLVSQIMGPKINDMLVPSLEAAMDNFFYGSKTEKITEEETNNCDEWRIFSVDTKEIIDETKPSYKSSEISTYPTTTETRKTTPVSVLEASLVPSTLIGSPINAEQCEVENYASTKCASFTLGSNGDEDANSENEDKPGQEFQQEKPITDSANDSEKQDERKSNVENEIDKVGPENKSSKEEEMLLTDHSLTQANHPKDVTGSSTRCARGATENLDDQLESVTEASDRSLSETGVNVEAEEYNINDLSHNQMLDNDGHCVESVVNSDFDETGEIDENLSISTDESEPELESPAFEKIGEISPVRVEVIADPEFISSYYGEQLPDRLSSHTLKDTSRGNQETLGTGKNENKDLEIDSMASDKLKGNDCKFLEPSDLPLYSEKCQFYEKFKL